MNMDNYRDFDQFKVTEPITSVVHVEINRSHVHNAFDSTTWRQFGRLFQKLDADAAVKVIILTGAGKNFSAGLDIKDAASEFQNFETDKRALYDHIVEFQRDIGTPARISTPTICLLHGLCIGLALDIAGTVPIRIVTKDAKLSIREIAIGIVADIGSLQRLPALFNNKSKLNEFALTAEFFKWDQVESSGFVSHVAEGKASGFDKCLEIAKKISQYDRKDIRGTKTSISTMTELGVAKGLEDIANYNAINLDPKAIIGRIKRVIKL